MAVVPATRSRISQTNWFWVLRWFFAPILGMGLLALWIAVVEAEYYPRFILPHPFDIFDRMQVLYERGILERHVLVTLKEALAGLAFSIVLALPLGYIVARSKWLSALLLPYLVAIRAIPVVAIAALIVIWLGTDIKSKIFVVTFITWFPLMEATVVGVQNVDSHLRDLMRAYQANPLQVFWKLELPAAMPNLMSGLKISATLAVVGAAVGELIGASQGLAYLIVFGRGTSDAPLVFGAVGILTVLSLAFYGVVAALEHFVLAWRRA